MSNFRKTFRLTLRKFRSARRAGRDFDVLNEKTNENDKVSTAVTGGDPRVYVVALRVYC